MSDQYGDLDRRLQDIETSMKQQDEKIESQLKAVRKCQKIMFMQLKINSSLYRVIAQKKKKNSFWEHHKIKDVSQNFE